MLGFKNFLQPQQPPQDQREEARKERTRQLLGLKDFPIKTEEEKELLLGSKERLLALQSITADTYPPRKKEIKKGIIIEVIERKLIPLEILKNNPVVYIGSGLDIEYPLALGARDIYLVDPILEDEAVKQDLIEKIKKLISVNPESTGNRINFQFNFGEGEEPVSVELVAKEFHNSGKEKSGNYELQDNTGVIILFASQGPDGQIKTEKAMREKLVPSGVILEEHTIISKDGQKLDLGK